MSEATKTQKQPAMVVVTVKVRPIERLAIEQAAQQGNTTMSRVARQAILRGLNATGKKAGA